MNFDLNMGVGEPPFDTAITPRHFYYMQEKKNNKFDGVRKQPTGSRNVIKCMIMITFSP